MLMKTTHRVFFQSQNTLSLLFARRAFNAGAVAKQHSKQHSGAVMETRFYENDFVFGKDSELEIMRSPFYDLARKEKMDKEGANQVLEEITHKLNYLEGLDVLLQPPVPTKENVAY